ncbi:MAG: flagellar basal body L-ring protein FlgH [Steroidobacteraceae bacterium]
MRTGLNRLRQMLGSAAAAVPALLLMGCVTAPHVEDYSATWPEEPAPVGANEGAIYQVGHDVALFENAVARRVGDTVTIKLLAQTAASKSSTTKTSKDSSANLTGPKVFGRPVTVHGTEVLSASIDNSNSFDGSGDSSQSNKIQGDITVTVAKRLANGNLLVRGQKWIAINQGKEYVRIQGIIRPIDIEPDNSIASNKVGDAVIAYGAQGALNDANRPGILSRFFNSILF